MKQQNYTDFLYTTKLKFTTILFYIKKKVRV